MQNALRSLGEGGLFLYPQTSKEIVSSMKYVYLLESISHPGKRYIGITTDLQKRLTYHNSGKSPHTMDFKPWRIVVAIRFADDQKADVFEKYLKSGSGHAFAKRHF
ncbi:hypothetical protein ES703_63879 [subsurface metagenome]